MDRDLGGTRRKKSRWGADVSDEGVQEVDAEGISVNGSQYPVVAAQPATTPESQRRKRTRWGGDEATAEEPTTVSIMISLESHIVNKIFNVQSCPDPCAHTDGDRSYASALAFV